VQFGQVIEPGETEIAQIEGQQAPNGQVPEQRTDAGFAVGLRIGAELHPVPLPTKCATRLWKSLSVSEK
jgi:hypothetical protein